MKTILLGLVIAGVATVSLADALAEGKTALEQKKYFEAVDAFSAACENGNGTGCYNLGLMYENAVGVAQNKYKASTLYAQACRAQEPLGCSNMALLYDTP